MVNVINIELTIQYVVHIEHKHKLSKHNQETMNLQIATISETNIYSIADIYNTKYTLIN